MSPPAHPLESPWSEPGLILQALRDTGPLPPEQLGIAARIEYSAARRAADLLCQQGLVRIDDDGLLHYSAPCVPKLRLADRIIVALALADAAEPMTAAEIADDIDSDPHALNDALRKLITAGDVECLPHRRGGRGARHRYRLRREAGK